MQLFKAMSSGTTALVKPGAVPAMPVIAGALDPIRGMGADLFIVIGEQVRTFTAEGEIAPPSAALRIAAAYSHSQAPAEHRWDFRHGEHRTRVHLEEGEYVINHGPWRVVDQQPDSDPDRGVIVDLAGVESVRPGLGVQVDEEFAAVVALVDAAALQAVDFTIPPRTQPEAGHVAAMIVMGQRAVELTDAGGGVIGTQTIGALQARGFHAGTGEVYSADTLAVACAGAARHWAGEQGAREWVVVFGGGNTRVTLGDQALVAAEAELFASINWAVPGGE